MRNFFVKWFATSVGVLIASYLLPQIAVADIQSAVVAALVLGLVNVLVRPLLVLLTLPLTVLSLGLFLFVVNALLLSLVAYLVPGFAITSFWAALIGSMVISIIGGTINGMLKRDRH